MGNPPSTLYRIGESFCGWMLHPCIQSFMHSRMHASIHPTYPFTYLSTDSPAIYLSPSPFPATHASIFSPPPIHGLMGPYDAPISVLERMARSLCPQPCNLVHHIQGWPVDVIKNSPNSKAFQSSDRQGPFAKGKWKSLLGGRGV